ncbi:alkane 1-monooxygenase [Corynebacterium macginleyi]|nr:alkane 1-monooxygenase [Corynebacterium macginleyi]MBK4149515.1 alkane 1-monooxygenase [Corynebacterium macginleyi]MBK4158785.1 alkane 1-monooxygenase [Corynebacterium macginleyi]MBK4177552.1 alkane 1-monooxygenase [Corynebacterium macginleyi]
MSADTLFITIPTGVGVGINVKVLENFATHVALALGWQPNREGAVIGYPIG